MVRGARTEGNSWDKETLFTGYAIVSLCSSVHHIRASHHTCGVAEFLLDSLVERRAIVRDVFV